MNARAVGFVVALGTAPLLGCNCLFVADSCPQATELTVSPESVAFFATTGGGNPTSRTAGVTNGRGGSLTGLTVGTITYGAGASGWLTATLSSTTAPATLMLSASPSGLTPGSYTAAVPITSPMASNSPQTIAVTFTVAPGPAIGLSATAVTFTDTLSTSDNPAQTVTVSNSGLGTLLGLAVGTINYGTGPSGWLTAALNQATAPATLTLSVAKGALAAGTYTATVPITSAVASSSPQSVAVTFTIAPPTQATLTVAGSGTGSGTVISTPVGISCPITSGSTSGDCTAAFDVGTLALLTPTASSGSRFAGWSGACSGTGQCQVTMSQARNVTATFAIEQQFTLTVRTAGNGFGAVNGWPPPGFVCLAVFPWICSAPVNSGTSVTLIATPATGSVFAGWSGVCSGTGTCQVSMTQDQTVTATFTSQ